MAENYENITVYGTTKEYFILRKIYNLRKQLLGLISQDLIVLEYPLIANFINR